MTSLPADLLERPPERVRKAGTGFLRKFAWDDVWTLTLRGSVPHPRARQMVNRWLNTMATEVLRAHFRTAWVIEGFRPGEHYHAHLLIQLLEGVGADTAPADPAWLSTGRGAHERLANDAWHNTDRAAGFTLRQPYVRAGREEDSIEDYIGKEAAWDMTIVCPRRSRCKRRHGCDFFSGPRF